MSRHRRSEGKKGGIRRAENNKIYAHPIPLVFLQSYVALGLSRHIVLNPCCEGYWDPLTRSVWVTNPKDSAILWQRGFFGKGNLSRSEPSWLSRQVNARKAALSGKVTSEEITTKRREQRKRFKMDRANAIAAAAAEAEEAFRTGKTVTSSIIIPSGATWKPAEKTPEKGPPTISQSNNRQEEDSGDLNSIVDVEHLQLTPQEAFFLIWCFDCLSIMSPQTDEGMSLQEIWIAFQTCYMDQRGLNPEPALQLRPDNPFLVNYVAYHHYRSLGWTIKSGVKFCVDYLLYKRGPVFDHAEFALLICPTYEDLADSDSPTRGTRDISWSWLSTINRVNSQVMKTLILCYVTIPSSALVTTEMLGSPKCLAYYSVREVTVRRFIPARMRD
ncbi:hypothetical protein BJ322DRAFT_1059914 [Thelephora terrestris]|uniref:tRNA-splicing endonuclease subunit Sen2 n=1 Tax=Thelephora terrestris TaxID=56493 RepID=A0A9P6L8A2_9AGAM|nr:hypothetical protein BJ322DRAFT_1059914 [Thelephora terrestris]